MTQPAAPPIPATTAEDSTAAVSTTLVFYELVTSRWRMEETVDGEATLLPIGVYTVGCLTSAGAEMTTEVARVDVVEHEDTVEITAWVRRRHHSGPPTDPPTTCAGVARFEPREVVLESPLGDRILMDAGPTPPVEHSRRQGR